MSIKMDVMPLRVKTKSLSLRGVKIKRAFRSLKPYSCILTALLFLSSMDSLLAQQKKPKHIYQMGSLEEGKTFMNNQYFLPSIPGLGEYYTLDSNSVKGVQCIKIDKENMVALAYVFPPPMVTYLYYLENNEKKSIRFIPNGFFVSTVDLMSDNCQIFYYLASGLEKKNYIPKGEYIWYIGSDGAMLDNGFSGFNNKRWIILFEKPLDEFPESVICVMDLKVLPDQAGFQIGPSGGTIYSLDSKKNVPILFTIKMSVYD